MIKYDRNGFKPRPRQLILTQTAAYVIEEAKIKQRVLYTSLKGQNNVIIYISPLRMFLFWAKSVCYCLVAGISVSNLSDGIIVFHITCEDPKQKVCGFITCRRYFGWSELHLLHFSLGTLYYSVNVNIRYGSSFTLLNIIERKHS